MNYQALAVACYCIICRKKEYGCNLFLRKEYTHNIEIEKPITWFSIGSPLVYHNLYKELLCLQKTKCTE